MCPIGGAAPTWGLHGSVCAMPDRGRSGGRGTPPDDGPDYGWLYGGQQSSSSGTSASPPHSAGSDDPEPTRMLPRMDRPEATATASRGGDGPPPQRPVQPAQPVPPAKAKKPRRKRPVGKIIVLVLVAWIVFLIAVPLWAWSTIDKVDADPGGARPAEQ